MKYIVPSDFCDLASNVKSDILISAENALRDKKRVFFQNEHFTNIDELKYFLTERCKSVQATHDWPGEIIDDIG
jgi:hypothetical protein